MAESPVKLVLAFIAACLLVPLVDTFGIGIGIVVIAVLAGLGAVIRYRASITGSIREWYRTWKEQKASEAAATRELEIKYLHSCRTAEDMFDLDPIEFEELVLCYFRTCGFRTAPTKASADGGVDGVLTRGDSTYFVQCKRYQPDSNVGEPAIRDFFGALTKGEAKGGMFVTTSSFTPSALKFARGTPIELIDGKELFARIEALY